MYQTVGRNLIAKLFRGCFVIRTLAQTMTHYQIRILQVGINRLSQTCVKLYA